MATSLLFCLSYYLAGSCVLVVVHVMVVVHVLVVGKSLVIDDLSLDISDLHRVQFVMLCKGLFSIDCSVFRSMVLSNNPNFIYHRHSKRMRIFCVSSDHCHIKLLKL